MHSSCLHDVFNYYYLFFFKTFLKGIDKGEIVSSGAPQVSKDGRNSSEFMQTRRMKLGVSPSLGSKCFPLIV